MKTTFHTDTIAAQATPPGKGGIAIIRVSGPAVKQLIRDLTGSDLSPRSAKYLTFRDTKDAIIDEGVAIFFPHPHSFTGEDVLELHGHGSPIVVDLLMQRLLTLGVRLARPGEFSERAFLNGKIDLIQAEAIADLINASSKQAAQSAIKSLQGEFSRCIQDINKKVIELRMFVEAAIDFTDEEIDFLSDENIKQRVNTILHDLISIQNKAKQGSLLREGITVVIAGEPNVGKSSLLNYLSGKELAIVTDIPGTTRDVLRDHILIDGMPIHIIDTAGLRLSDDVVEQEGIRRAYQEMQQADIVLYVLDASNPTSLDLNSLPISSPSVIFIRNKIDLVQETPSVKKDKGYTYISLSVKSGAGIDCLINQIKTQVGLESHHEGIYLARRRHLDALTRAYDYVIKGLNQLVQSYSGELAAEDFRQAHLALCEITGEFTSDDLLGHIFSNFCIGK